MIYFNQVVRVYYGKTQDVLEFNTSTRPLHGSWLCKALMSWMNSDGVDLINFPYLFKDKYGFNFLYYEKDKFGFLKSDLPQVVKFLEENFFQDEEE